MLANERTLLSYIRTALTLVAVGASVALLIDAPRPMRITGWILLVIGLATLVIGAWRFVRVARRLRG